MTRREQFRPIIQALIVAAGDIPIEQKKALLVKAYQGSKVSPRYMHWCCECGFQLGLQPERNEAGILRRERPMFQEVVAR